MKPFIFIGTRLVRAREIEGVRFFTQLPGSVAAEITFRSGRQTIVANEEAAALYWWATQEGVSVDATAGARARRDLETLGEPK